MRRDKTFFRLYSGFKTYLHNPNGERESSASGNGAKQALQSQLGTALKRLLQGDSKRLLRTESRSSVG
jgi:hypothetical protein